MALSSTDREFLTEIRPWLRLKGEQADLALKFYATFGQTSRGRPVLQDIKDRREVYMRRISALKRPWLGEVA